MKFLKYIKEEDEPETDKQEADEPKISSKMIDKLIEFFKNYKGDPDDNDIHAFAEKEKVEPAELEEEIYGLVTAFWAHGNSKGFTGKYDPEQIKMGIKVEYEHTNNPKMAERIAQDHLAEIPDYYTRLAQMEKEGKAAIGKKE